MLAHRTGVLAFSLVLAAATAEGQPLGALDTAIAQALSLRAQGRDAEALALLTAAWETSRSPRARAQMARAEQAVGRWLDANAHMTEALGSPDDPWIAARVGLLEEERARIRERLGRIEVLGLPDGARVRIGDGEPRTTPLGEPLWCAAGDVVLRVEAEGFFSTTRRVVVDAGRTARETVALVRVAAPPSSSQPRAPASPSPSPPARDPRLMIGIAGTITGGVFLAGGVAAHVVREVLVSAAADHGCANDTDGRLVGPADCAERTTSIGAATALLATGYAVGALFVGTGVALALTAPRASPATRRVACAPWNVGLACTFIF